MNIEKAVKIINNKKTTVDDVYKFIFKDIEKFQNGREDHYMQELKQQHEGTDINVTESYSERIAEKITTNIERDTIFYVKEYVGQSIDALLDAYNNKQIKDVNSVKNFISLLSQLKEVYAKEGETPYKTP